MMMTPAHSASIESGEPESYLDFRRKESAMRCLSQKKSRNPSTYRIKSMIATCFSDCRLTEHILTLQNLCKLRWMFYCRKRSSMVLRRSSPWVCIREMPYQGCSAIVQQIGLLLYKSSFYCTFLSFPHLLPFYFTALPQPTTTITI